MRLVRQPIIVAFAFLVAVAVMAGCGDSYGGRIEVNGKVNLVGEPIKDGVITFEPMDADNKGTKSGASITNGTYTVPRKQGLRPGKYVVSITSGDAGTPHNADENFAPGPSQNFTAVDRVPPEWNIQSNKQIEVKSDPTVQEFNFDIPNLNPKYKARKK